MDKKRIEQIVTQLISAIGEDPDREGLRKTPRRVAESFSHILCGYSEDADKVVNNAVFESHANNMIIIRNIEIYSMCEHHMLPFFGQCHIGYIASDKVLGASKVARIANVYARRLQIQERLTAQIADKVMSVVNAEGVGVVVECRHLCMMMRGVEKQNSVMSTSSVLGSFREEAATRTEFLDLISQK